MGSDEYRRKLKYNLEKLIEKYSIYSKGTFRLREEFQESEIIFNILSKDIIDIKLHGGNSIYSIIAFSCNILCELEKVLISKKIPDFCWSNDIDDINNSFPERNIFYIDDLLKKIQWIYDEDEKI